MAIFFDGNDLTRMTQQVKGFGKFIEHFPPKLIITNLSTHRKSNTIANLVLAGEHTSETANIIGLKMSSLRKPRAYINER